MGMIFNSTNTLKIITKLNKHFAPGANYDHAVANDPGHLAIRGTSTYSKSSSIGVDLDNTDTNHENWKKYLDNVVDIYNDFNNAGQNLGVTIINTVIGYLADPNCLGIQFFAIYSTTSSVTRIKEPAPGNKYYGSILVTSLSLDEALAEQQLARGRPTARRSARSGVQAPATRKRKKSES